jgi:hypothetical protein
MKTPKIYFGALAVFCITALVIGTAGAATMIQQGTNNNIKHQAGQFGLEKMLGNLTERGYDVSAIQTAVTSGDYKTAMTLMKEFRTAHPDAFPVHAQGAAKGQMNGQIWENRTLQMLSDLTAKGYDVSAITTAVTSGDYKTAMTLMKEFRTAHPDAFPACVAGAKGQMNAQPNGEKMLQMLGNLTAKGFDVSAITASVTSGDFRTAMTLLKEFSTAHPDAFPARIAGANYGTWAGRGGHRTTSN